MGSDYWDKYIVYEDTHLGYYFRITFDAYYCGYVLLPDDHKYYKTDYQDIPIDEHGEFQFGEIIDNKWCIIWYYSVYDSKSFGLLGVIKDCCSVIMQLENVDAELLIKKGMHLVSAGMPRRRYSEKLKLAIKYFTEALELEPNNTNVLEERGFCYFYLEDFDNVYKDLAGAIKIENPNSDVYFSHRAVSDKLTSKGIKLLKDTDDKDTLQFVVLKLFTKALELEPNNASALYERGWCYFRLNSFDNATKDLTDAIKLDSSNPDFYLFRGINWQCMKNDNEAINDFNKAMYLAPKDAAPYYWRGVSYYSLGDLDRAFSDVNKAIKLRSNDGDFYRFRGKIHNKMERYKKAIKDFDKALSLDSAPGTYYQRSLSYYYLDDLDKALDDVNTISSSIDLNWTYRLFRGILYSKMGDYRRAILHFNTTLRDNPNALLDFKNDCNQKLLSDFNTAISDAETGKGLKPGYQEHQKFLRTLLQWRKNNDNLKEEKP